MKKILLIYPPFCTPVIPPYGLANIYTFLKNNLVGDYAIDVIDLNLKFHNIEFGEYKDFFKNMDLKKYESVSKNFLKESSEIYSLSNKNVVQGGKPDHFKEILDQILIFEPDIVAFSIVYSSQAFYASSLIDELSKKGIETIIGGPAVNENLKKKALSLNNELELLDHIKGQISDHDQLNYNSYVDFSGFELDDYFIKEPVVPIRTSSSCYYRQCAFCTHHQNSNYYEFPIEFIKETIRRSGARHFFIIDDMVHKKRLLEIARSIKDMDVIWTCQLKPTKELDDKTLKELYDSGLRMIIWGVESGSDRVLKLMRKGTNRNDIKKVLSDSHKEGIKNVVYIMFGFPSETNGEFLETINLIDEIKGEIDLISTSVFGLQKGTPIYENPKEFKIARINEMTRTVLEPKIDYEVEEGLSNKEAKKLRNKHKKRIEKINKYPKTMNYFREHMLTLLE